MKGISLIEILVAIAIIATLSVIGTNSFLNIKNDAEIDAITDELISDIKLARNKSMNGELLEGEEESDFTEDGLPEYGLVVSANNYGIIRTCEKNVIPPDDCSTEDPLESINIDPKYKLSPPSKFYFERIIGETTPIVIMIKDSGDNYGREINISNDFVITVNEL